MTDGISTTTQSVTVNVTNVNEAPVISSLASTINVDENDTAVVTVSASDPESDSLTYSLSGTDASSFSISSSGVITFNSAPDYETKTSYSITVNVTDGTNSVSQSVTVNINDITENGSSGNDTINGGSGADTIKGLDGDDIINGNAGNDILRGGLGTDTINGGDGNDIISVDEYYGDFNIPFDDISDCCSVQTFSGQNVDGGAGHDTLYVHGAGNAIALGGSGNDTINVVSGHGSPNPMGYADGGDGDDVLNNVTSNGGDSQLKGGNGDDVLQGGSGSDRLYGGAGEDKFLVHPDHASNNLDNVSIAKDFVDGEDLILLTGDLEFSDLTISVPSNDQKNSYNAFSGCSNSLLVWHQNSGVKYLLILCSSSGITLTSDDFETGA